MLDGVARDRLVVHRLRQLVLREVAAPDVQPGQVHGLRWRVVGRAAEVPVIDQPRDLGASDQVVKDLAEPAAVQTLGRRRHAKDAGLRVRVDDLAP